MALVSFPNINNLDSATAELWNSRYAAILAQMNGNIDAANIKDSSVTYAKMNLSDGDLPHTKIGLTPGTDSGATRDDGKAKIGLMLLQWGESDIANGGTTVTFNEAYATAPTIIMTVRDTAQQTPWITAKTTTNFAAKQSYVTTPLPVQWLAIGKSAS